MDWVSNAKFGQDEKDGTVFTLKNGPFPVVIHQYVGCGRVLFMSCKALGISQFDLQTEDFDTAVVRSKQRIRETLNSLNTGFAPFLDSNEKNKIVRY